MLSNRSSILSSEPFRFFVGKNRIPFTLHSNALVGQSGPLLALINGDMVEAREGQAWLEDTDEETFARVGEYLYTGDYTPAKPDILLAHSQIAQESDDVCMQTNLERDALNDNSTSAAMEAPEIQIEQLPEETLPEEHLSRVSEWDFPCSTKRKKREKKKTHAAFSWPSEEEPEILKAEPTRSKRELLWDEFVDSIDTCDRDFRPHQNLDPYEDYSQVFLCHARLYVFADNYDIQPLAKLSLSKLRHTLAGFNFFEERREDIVELLQYCYANTPERVGTKDSLRALVIKYVACVVERLTGTKVFGSLLSEANSISLDLTLELLKRLD
jgi:hypothetical protein